MAAQAPQCRGLREKRIETENKTNREETVCERRNATADDSPKGEMGGNIIGRTGGQDPIRERCIIIVRTVWQNVPQG